MGAIAHSSKRARSTLACQRAAKTRASGQNVGALRDFCLSKGRAQFAIDEMVQLSEGGEPCSAPRKALRCRANSYAFSTMRKFLIWAASFRASTGTKPWTLDRKSHIYAWAKPLTLQGG
jgi:hypothetical protein